MNLKFRWQHSKEDDGLVLRLNGVKIGLVTPSEPHETETYDCFVYVGGLHFNAYDRYCAKSLKEAKELLKASVEQLLCRLTGVK